MKRAPARVIIAVVGILCPSFITSAAEVSFAAKPKITRTGGGAKIEFTVSAPTDVEVAILAGTNVVRHLAAGVLGATNAPPAPLKPGLAQALDWDGKDDFGRPVTGLTTVRVRAGMGATFGRLIGEDPYTFGLPEGLAADEDGNLYVLGRQGTHYQYAMTIRVFDAEGRYLREVMPFPANLATNAMKNVAHWDEPNQRWVPRTLVTLRPDFYSGGILRLISATKAGGLFFGDAVNTYQLGLDGSVTGSALQTRSLMWEKKLHHWGGIAGQGQLNMATSPDGQYLYLSGLSYSRDQYKDRLIPGRVWRLNLKEPGAVMQPFVDIPVTSKNWQKGGVDDGRATSPTHGVAVDGKGQVYICDRVTDRVAIFSPDAKPIGEIAVANPDLVTVHPKTGAIYVLRRLRTGYYQYDVSLEKFASFDKGAVSTASHKFDNKAMTAQIALVLKGDKTIMWVSGVKGGLQAILDKGTSFELMETQFKPRPDAQIDWNRLAVDYQRDVLYASDGGYLFWRYDGRTGEGGILKKGGKPFNGVDLAVGYDGLLYVRSGTGFSGPMERYTTDLEPAPMTSGSHVFSKYIYSRFGCGNCEKGLGVGPHGEVYVSFMYDWCKYFIGGWGGDGKPLPGSYLHGKAPGKGEYPKELNSGVIGPIPSSSGGVRVDLQGNIYLGLYLMPDGATPPPGLEKSEGYRGMVGSVIKFSPKGGAVMGIVDSEGKQSGLPQLAMMNPASKAKVPVEGGVTAYPGIAPFSGGGVGAGCCCRVPRFDIDRYGRLALPNAILGTVKIYDNAGNLITEVGKYGNFDSQYVNPATPEGQSGKPTIATPDIPLSWPTGAGFSETSLYINDTYARRAIRADLTCKAEETVALK